jgi:RNA polymerase-binding transcription factor DksA
MLKKFRNIFSKKQERTDIDAPHFKKLLKKELKRLDAELKTIGYKKKNTSEWESKATDVDVLASDSADIADNIENYESNNAILKQLQIEYDEIIHALENMKKGAYGICEISGEPIEIGRLEANPAARTCMAHKNTKLS